MYYCYYFMVCFRRSLAQASSRSLVHTEELIAKKASEIFFGVVTMSHTIRHPDWIVPLKGVRNTIGIT